MDTNTEFRTATCASARLLIHVESDVGNRYAGTPWRWLRALYSAAPAPSEHVPLRLQIRDLQGQEVLALEDGGPMIVVTLAAGTYHVSACRAYVKRGYTMTLTQGGSFDLYLNLAPVAAV